jgi:hypothetical protein
MKASIKPGYTAVSKKFYVFNDIVVCSNYDGLNKITNVPLISKNYIKKQSYYCDIGMWKIKQLKTK